MVFTRVGTIKYVKNPYSCKENSGVRFSVVTSAKNQKSAVKRNLIRRQAYQIIGTSPIFARYLLGLESGTCLESLEAVLFLSKQAYGMPYEQLYEHISILLRKIA